MLRRSEKKNTRLDLVSHLGKQSAAIASWPIDRIRDRQLLRHGAVGLWTPEKNAQGLKGVVDRVIDRRGFIAAMCHTVGALGVTARAITLPISFFHQSFEGRCVTFVHKQITGFLPPEHVTCRISPGHTAITFVAGKKIQKQAGVVEAPLALSPKPEDIPEQPFARIAPHKNLLARGMLITVPWGNSHCLDPETRDIVEKVCHFFSRFALEQGTVYGYAETPFERLLNRFHGLIKHSCPTDRSIMPIAAAIQMHRKG